MSARTAIVAAYAYDSLGLGLEAADLLIERIDAALPHMDDMERAALIRLRASMARDPTQLAIIAKFVKARIAPGSSAA